MNKKKLSMWLKAIALSCGIFGIVIFFLLLPYIGSSVTKAYPEFQSWYWPWLLFLWAVAVPFFTALCYGFRIAQDIAKGRSFSFQNAGRLKKIAICAAADCGILFAGNCIMLFLNMNHPSVFLAMLFVIFIGCILTVGGVCLSHFVYNAAELQQEQDLTV